MTKSEIRQLIRARLQTLSPAAREEQAALLCRGIAVTPEWQRARVVALFAPLPTEPDVELLWPAREGRTFCYPRMVDLNREALKQNEGETHPNGERLTNGERLAFYRVAARTELEPTRWGLREPPEENRRVEPGCAEEPPGNRRVPLGEIDLILVPGLAFTLKGARLGRGGGFYDRALADPELRAVRFGVCFQEQLLPSLPQEAHDQSVERVFAGGMGEG